MAHSVHVRLELRHGAPPHAAPAAGTPSPDCGGLSAPNSPQGDLSLQWSSSPIVCPARLSGVCSSCRASIGCVCVCGCEHEACVLSVRCVCDRRGVRACICSMCLCVCACVMWGGGQNLGWTWAHCLKAVEPGDTWVQQAGSTELEEEE